MDIFFLGSTAVIIFIAIFSSAMVFEKHSTNINGESRSFLLYLAGLIFSGFLSCALLTHFLVDKICLLDSGAGCAFGVIAIIQPFSIIIGVALFMTFWVWAKEIPDDETNI